MEWIFKSIADYIDFSIDFILLAAMSDYVRLDRISPTLVFFLVVGVSISYLISLEIRIPQITESPENEPGKESERNLDADNTDSATQNPSFQNYSPKGKLEGSLEAGQLTVAWKALYFVIGAPLFHGYLLIYAHIFGAPDVHSVKNTINAVLAVNSLWVPFTAAIDRVGRFFEPFGAVGAFVYGLMEMLLGLSTVFYTIYALAAVHGDSISSMALPNLIPLGVATLFVLFPVLGPKLRAKFARRRIATSSE